MTDQDSDNSSISPCASTGSSGSSDVKKAISDESIVFDNCENDETFGDHV